jgi:L-cysteine desulfidase
MYKDILREELRAAMGCTEPIAIAYAAAILRDLLGGIPTSVRAGFSGNIIKNVKSVIVPQTGGRHGIEVAIASGLVSGRYDKRLEVLTTLTESDLPGIDAVLTGTRIDVREISGDCTFELVLEGALGDLDGAVHISGEHTNVILARRGGEVVTEKYLEKLDTGVIKRQTDRSVLSVEGIIDFAEHADISDIRELLLGQINMNMDIAREGLRGGWGASIGKVILSIGDDVSRRARAYAAAGSDARMSGCEKPVCIISGSGNQGITASVPVAVYAEHLGSGEDEMLRALIVSDLITVHQKTGIGTLSAYCGAISAGVGAGAGICYLLGGRYNEIAHTVVNAVAILSGTICDGAKPSCAAKIAMAVEAGILGYEMSRLGEEFLGGDGIVTKGVENTIRNVGRLARDGMSETDREIIKIMLNN